MATGMISCRRSYPRCPFATAGWPALLLFSSERRGPNDGQCLSGGRMAASLTHWSACSFPSTPRWAGFQRVVMVLP